MTKGKRMIQLLVFSVDYLRKYVIFLVKIELYVTWIITTIITIYRKKESMKLIDDRL